MKIHIEIDEDLAEDELHIRCRQMTDGIRRIRRAAQEQSTEHGLTAYRGDEMFYLLPEDILFFETEGDAVYAHTATEAYRVKQRLYELEKLLPRDFMRVSKSAILNAARVYSLSRQLASSSTAGFKGTHKQVFVSRLYGKTLRLRLTQTHTL